VRILLSRRPAGPSGRHLPRVRRAVVALLAGVALTVGPVGAAVACVKPYLPVTCRTPWSPVCGAEAHQRTPHVIRTPQPHRSGHGTPPVSAPPMSPPAVAPPAVAPPAVAPPAVAPPAVAPPAVAPPAVAPPVSRQHTAPRCAEKPTSGQNGCETVVAPPAFTG